jgi:hypothetical protein
MTGIPFGHRYPDIPIYPATGPYTSDQLLIWSAAAKLQRYEPYSHRCPNNRTSLAEGSSMSGRGQNWASTAPHSSWAGGTRGGVLDSSEPLPASLLGHI